MYYQLQEPNIPFEDVYLYGIIHYRKKQFSNKNLI
jgi:hypothetical protein